MVRDSQVINTTIKITSVCDGVSVVGVAGWPVILAGWPVGPLAGDG